jgi:hypothetical protein
VFDVYMIALSSIVLSVAAHVSQDQPDVVRCDHPRGRFNPLGWIAFSSVA